MVNHRDTVNLINEVEDLRERDNAYNLRDVEMQLAFGISVWDKNNFSPINIDLTGILEFKVNLIETRFESDTGNYGTTIKELGYHICNEEDESQFYNATDHPEDYRKKFNESFLSNLYCIDNFENLEVYGSWQSDFRFISTIVNRCKDKEFCKDENEIEDLLNSY